MFVRRSLPFVIAMALLLAVVFLGGGQRGQRLTFLAVGQGDCIVWQDDGVTFLVDVGPKTRTGFDAGKRIVLPKLRKLDVRSVDFILITHPDGDHIGGLLALRSKFPAAKLIANESFRNHSEMRRWLKEAGLQTEDVKWVSGQYRVTLPNSQIYIAAPHLPATVNDNEGSLFVQIRSKKSVAVLTGDASMATEDTMQRGLNWSGQVLKAGHHGSRTSTSESFLRSVAPRWAVISCGRENAFGHPHRSVMDVLKKQGVATLRTDKDGDVAFEPGANGFVPVLD